MKRKREKPVVRVGHIIKNPTSDEVGMKRKREKPVVRVGHIIKNPLLTNWV